MTKTFEITIRPQFAAYDDKGTTVEIRANTKAEAISQARKMNRHQGFYDRFNGKISYTGREA